MGIVNVTPDSFSDGGEFFQTDKAVEHALRLLDEGADIVDVGGESTRPPSRQSREAARPVDDEEELRRVIPVIERIASRTNAPISVDTTKAAVARAALHAGAAMVNDVSGFTADAAMPRAIAEMGASAVVMHRKGTPETMQNNPVYDDLFGEIQNALAGAIAIGRDAGIHQMFVDPGIGFGKTFEHNYRLIAGISRFHRLGLPVLVGPSRKAFLGAPWNRDHSQRLEGTIAAVTAAVLAGVHVVRVHDVAPIRKALDVADEIARAAQLEEPAQTA